MSKKGKPSEPTQDGNSAELENTQNLGKIREILFGNQTREIEQRFAVFEERMLRELNSVRDEHKRSLETLEEFMKNQFDSFSAKFVAIREEQDELEERLNKGLGKSTAELQEKLSGDLKESSAELLKKNRQLGERLDQVQRKLREELLGQCRELRAEQQATAGSLSRDLSIQSERLNATKLSRTDLAAMFSEVVVSLSDEAEA